MKSFLSLILIYFVLMSCSRAEVPDAILSTEGQPILALFEKQNETYALGCQEILFRWSGVPVKHLTAQQWGESLLKTPVIADIHCDSRTQPFQSTGEPGSLVFVHRNGQTFRHYVDDPGFENAIKGVPVKSVSPQELQTIAPNRGIDFHSRVALSEPDNSCRATACLGAVQVCCGSGKINGICIGVTACPDPRRPQDR